MPGMALLSKRGRRSSTEGLLSAIRTGTGRDDAEGGLFTPSLIRHSPRDAPHHTQAPVQLLFQAIGFDESPRWWLRQQVLRLKKTANCGHAKQKMTPGFERAEVYTTRAKSRDSRLIYIDLGSCSCLCVSPRMWLVL